MSLDLEKTIARVPLWAGVPDLKVTPLGGGITNHNYRIDAGAQSYVLRIVGANTGLLGIDRDNEYAANRLAGESQIAPQVVYFIQPEGYLVTRFIQGQPIPPEEMRQPQVIRQVAAVLRQVHSLPPIPGRFDAFRIVEAYTQVANRYGVDFPPNFTWLIERARAAEAALLHEPYQPHFCHNDLLNENFLFDGRIRLLDWEYAGMGDVFFDLANFSVNHDFADQQDRQLLAGYFGAFDQRSEPSRTRWARLKVMRILSDFREAMWGLVQCGISDLDFDFRTYADQHFERLTRNMHDPLWEQWIKDLSTSA
jgi:thiamine kinase-like enzyme